jgi:hypothetical protein
MAEFDTYVADEMNLFEARFPHCDHTKYNNGERSPGLGRVRYAEPEIDKMFSAWLAAKLTPIADVDNDLRILAEDIAKAIDYCDERMADRFGGFIKSVLTRCQSVKVG